jgi:Zn-dependent protease with chaperone function
MFITALITKNILPLLIYLFFERIFAIPFCALNRLSEKFADEFAAKKIGKRYIINVLKKSQYNHTLIYNKLIYYLVFYPFNTHSSTEERIKNLEKK